MTPERYQRILELFEEASKRAPNDRAAFLAESCAGDEDLRRQVEAMLAADSRSGGFLEKPPDDLAAARLAAQEHHILDRPAWDAAPSRPGNGRLTPGAQIGPYKIEAALGAGGMGEVYRALDTRLKRTVAIKVAKERFSARFEREARAIAALNHPNICTLHDVGPDYLVMELVEGETLAAKLKKGKLSIDDTLLYGGQIAAALAEAHSKGITHRDLKPGNIMVAKNGVKVLDFGLAKSAGDETVTVSRAIMGTPGYMAPEQLEGKECDARTDIYALGLVLREMATDLPPHVAHVVERCVAKDPDVRWQSARDVKAELEWIAKGGTTVSPQGMARSHSKLPW